MGLTHLWDAYGMTFVVTAIVIGTIAAAVLLGLYGLERKRRGRPWGKAVPVLLVITAIVIGAAGGATRTLQQAGGLQRQEGTVLELNEDTNRFSRQTEVDLAAFDALIDRVGEERLQDMERRFAGADMMERHRMRVEHGYTASDMLAYYVRKMRGGAGGDASGKGNAYYRAVMELDPRAIEAAERAGDPDPANPMHGAIVLVKGNIAVAGLANDAGSWALADATATADADVVRNLRDRGAIIAGRTNLSEFANFLTVSGPNGFSGRGGQTLSPMGPLTVDPSGSSTGSAVAIALDYADVTVGTETSGSVISPAGAAGVVGLKASHDGCSITGIVPIDGRIDSVGFLGRSTRDVRLAHDSACLDEAAPATDHANSGAPAASASASGAPAAIMVLGDVPQSLRDRASRANVRIIDAPQKVADLAARFDEVDADKILLGGFGPSLEAHLRNSPGAAKSAADVAAYYGEHTDTAPYGYSIVSQAAEVDDEGRAAGERELERVRGIAADLDAALREEGVDALVTSSTDLSAMSLAGVPRISVPLEKKDPADVYGTESPEVSFQVTAARADALPQVLSIAAALEAGK